MVKADAVSYVLYYGGEWRKGILSHVTVSGGCMPVKHGLSHSKDRGIGFLFARMSQLGAFTPGEG